MKWIGYNTRIHPEVIEMPPGGNLIEEIFTLKKITENDLLRFLG